jgi:hypothetical protein
LQIDKCMRLTGRWYWIDYIWDSAAREEWT